MTSHIVRTEGLVLRNLRYGDTSRVATLFTPDLGKISVIGKGVREPRSPFGASLELFARSEFVLYFRSGRNLQMLKSGDVLDVHRGLQESTFRFVYGSAVLEFLDRMLLEEEATRPLYGLALRVLARLQCERRTRVREIFRAFQLRAASILGYGVLLDACLHCGRSIEMAAQGRPDDAGTWLFRPSEGGALCPSCARSAESGHPLTVRALLRIRSMVRAEIRSGEAGAGSERLADQPPGETETEAARRADAELRWAEALDRIVEDFLHFHVERYRGLKSLRIGGS